MNRYLYTHVHSSITHNSQKCPSRDEQINKTQLYIHTLEYYPDLKRKETDTCDNMDEPWKHNLSEVSQIQ